MSPIRFNYFYYYYYYYYYLKEEREASTYEAKKCQSPPGIEPRTTVYSSKHRCPGQGGILVVIVPLSRRGRWVGMSVFLVLALVSQLVLWCVIACSRVRLSVWYWLLLLCAGLPSFVWFKNQCLPFYSIIIIIIILRKKTPCGIQNYKRCLPQPVACTNRLNTLRKKTGWMTNSETRHRHANSPSSRR